MSIEDIAAALNLIISGAAINFTEENYTNPVPEDYLLIKRAMVKAALLTIDVTGHPTNTAAPEGAETRQN